MKKTIQDFLGCNGMMISCSKSGYGEIHPRNIAVFNANIVDGDRTKIWYGDIDITKDLDKLQEASKVLSTKLYVLRESDGRFEYEESPRIERAVIIVDGDEVTVGEDMKNYVKKWGSRLLYKKEFERKKK